MGVPGTLAADADPPVLARYFAVVVDAGKMAAAAMLIPPHRLVLSRTERPEALRLIAQDLHADRIMPPGVHAPVAVGERFARFWQQLTGQRREEILRQRIYRLEHVRAIGGIPGRLRAAVEGDAQVIIPWVRDFFAEAFGEHATDRRRATHRPAPAGAERGFVPVG